MERAADLPMPLVTASVAVRFDRLYKEGVTDFLNFRRSESGAIRRFAPGRRGSPEDFVRDRLDAGHACLLARFEGRIVSAVWGARDLGPVPYLECNLAVGAEGVYVYDAFTDAGFRGRNIAPALATELIERFRSRGCRRVVMAVLPENQPGLRVWSKIGFKPCGRIGYWGVGRWKHHFCRSPSYRIVPV